MSVVALTATTQTIDGMPRVRLNQAYVDAVVAAGLTPIVVAPLAPAHLPSVLDAVQGVVLTGGEDVNPAEYGAPAHPATADQHTARDACELALAKAARARRLPTLAICRGLQVVNVALGGTLIQDIPSECPSEIVHDQSRRRRERVHDVTVDAQSRLARALDAARLTVNSSHHQALARVAQGLRITARAPDDIIEGAEWTGDDWWMLGVQWHPEELVQDGAEWDRNLFAEFARVVNATRRASSAPRPEPAA